MGGGVLVLLAFLLGGTLLHRPTRLAAAWSWVLSFATVVVAGYAIEMNTQFFVGGLVYVFVTPAMFRPGYIISSLGLLVVGFALLLTLWWGAIGHTQRQVERRVHETTLPYTQSDPERKEARHEVHV